MFAAVKALCPKYYKFTKTVSPSQDLKSFNFFINMLWVAVSGFYKQKIDQILRIIQIDHLEVYNFIFHKMSIISKLKKWT